MRVQGVARPIFAAAHKSHQGPLLIYTGSFQEEEPVQGRDMRLLDMDGNVVRVLKGVGGYGMLCNNSLDDFICVKLFDYHSFHWLFFTNNNIH
jgi:hypothetical protein